MVLESEVSACCGAAFLLFGKSVRLKLRERSRVWRKLSE